MIITKGVTGVKGYIEYRYDFKRGMFNCEITEDDRDAMFESDTFESLEELLQKIHPDVLAEIKHQFNADEVWISHISFSGKSEDGTTTSTLSMSEGKKNSGHVATEIKNEDIDNRLLLNLQQVKTIIDNTLEQYPVKYSG